MSATTMEYSRLYNSDSISLSEAVKRLSMDAAMAINAVAAAVLLQALTTSPQFVNTVEDVRLAVVAPYVPP